MYNAILEALMEERKRGTKRKIGYLSFEERIKNLEAEIEGLKSVIELQKYLHKIRNYRGIYVVEIRRHICKRLEKRGFSISEIGRVIGKHHSTVIHMLHHPFEDHVTVEVAENIDKWIAEGFYPKSYVDREPSYYHPKGVKSVINYRLIKL